MRGELFEYVWCVYVCVISVYVVYCVCVFVYAV